MTKVERYKATMAILEGYKKATADLQSYWEGLRDEDPDLADEMDEEYPFIEDLIEVVEQVDLWVNHQVEKLESKIEWA